MQFPPPQDNCDDHEYIPPDVEIVISSEEIEQEVLYAGSPVGSGVGL